MPKKYVPTPAVNPDDLREIFIDYTQQELRSLRLAFEELFESKTLLHQSEEQEVRDIYDKFIDASKIGSITRTKRRIVLNVIQEFLEEEPVDDYED